MYLLGEVLHVSKDHRLIVRADRAPKSNTQVYAQDGNTVGRIAEVFGPMKKPFVSVKPFKNVDFKKIEGEEVFIK